MSEALLQPRRRAHAYRALSHPARGETSTVPRGGLTMLLGRNGAGKTTTLRTIMGLWQASSGRDPLRRPGHHDGLPPPISPEPGSPTCRKRWQSSPISPFARTSCWPPAADPSKPNRLDWILGLFPALERFWNLPAGNLSGGQKQMLAIARAIAEPRRLLLVDEPTKGLAPVMVRSMIEAFRRSESGRRDHPARRAEFFRRVSPRRPRGRRWMTDASCTRGPCASSSRIAICSSACSASAWTLTNDRYRNRATRTLADCVQDDWLPLPSRAGARWCWHSRFFGDLSSWVTLTVAGSRHGHDDLPHGLRPHARLRTDGRHQFRPRRLHLARRLRDADRARTSCRLGGGRFARGSISPCWRLCIGAAMAVTAAVGALFERVIVRPVYGSHSSRSS